MFSKIAIIGTGNVGTWLFQTLKNKNDIEVVAISGRKIETLTPNFDLYIFALKDDVYEDILKQITFKMLYAVHTSGSLSQNILFPYACKFGVIYPYQSITNYELQNTNYEVPVCVEGSENVSEDRLFRWVNSVFDIVHKINEKQRFAMHLAAVFANNFTNAMYGIAYDIFKENNLDWSLILPLLENTLKKVNHQNPKECQTGPAKRGDISIMEKHSNSLHNNDLKEIYKKLSIIIQQNQSANH
ncbi:MAG: DUF2520 domain-containing protein [Bacteroidales bacterium]|jgi:hypothetical protein|nr:DUF2520 domain-containing protein [Bacteroidales bacterium]